MKLLKMWLDIRTIAKICFVGNGYLEFLLVPVNLSLRGSTCVWIAKAQNLPQHLFPALNVFIVHLVVICYDK